MTVIQTIVRQPSSAEIDEREHLWRTTVRDRLATIDLRSTGRLPRFPSADFRDLGDLLITDWNSPGFEGFRSKQMGAHESEALVLMTVFDGRQIVKTPSKTVVTDPGDLLILRTSSACNIVVPESISKRTVRIPLAALASLDTGPNIPEIFRLRTTQNPLAKLAHDYLMGVGCQIDRMSSVEVEGARNALLVLTAGMVRATQAADISESDFLPYLRQQLEAWIVDHLTMGAIRVRDLAAAHNVGSRTVHRAFAASGTTVGSVVRSHRIAGARSDLVNTNASIATIAHRWGFCDASHLGREFRRVHSMSPGDYREAYSVA